MKMKDVREILAGLKRTPAEMVAGRTLIHEDPIAVLWTLGHMAAQRNRHATAFDVADLERVARAWERACVAGLGDLDFVQERAKFQGFANRLVQGQRERNQDGVLFLEDRDWPPVRVLLRAMKRLGYAEMRTVAA